jgi:hypothetical protein
VKPVFISCGAREDGGHLRPASIAQARAEGLACGGGERRPLPQAINKVGGGARGRGPGMAAVGAGPGVAGGGALAINKASGRWGEGLAWRRWAQAINKAGGGP